MRYADRIYAKFDRFCYILYKIQNIIGKFTSNTLTIFRLKNIGPKRSAPVSGAIIAPNTDTQYWVPCWYISAGVPSRVEAEKKLASTDRASGRGRICRSAIRNSRFVDCFPPEKAWNTPIPAEITNMAAKTT